MTVFHIFLVEWKWINDFEIVKAFEEPGGWQCFQMSHVVLEERFGFGSLLIDDEVGTFGQRTIRRGVVRSLLRLQGLGIRFSLQDLGPALSEDFGQAILVWIWGGEGSAEEDLRAIQELWEPLDPVQPGQFSRQLGDEELGFVLDLAHAQASGDPSALQDPGSGEQRLIDSRADVISDRLILESKSINGKSMKFTQDLQDLTLRTK